MDPNKYSPYGQQPGYPPQPGYAQPGYPPQPGYGQPPNVGFNTAPQPYPQAPYGGQPPYNPGAPYVAPPPQSAPGMQPPSYDASQPMMMGGTGFSSKEIRLAFVRKVYSILMVQLSITTAFIALFVFHDGTRRYVAHNSWLLIFAMVTFFIVYFILVCCEGVRRSHPTNFIMLGIFTLAMSFMTGAIAGTYNEKTVLIAFGVCAVVCAAVTIFSFNTKYDFTSCAGVLFVISIVFILFGLMCMFIRVPVLHLVYACVGALLFMVFLAFDTQMIMGGKKLEISPEEHIFAALQLYMDIVQIFLFLLQIIGSGDRN